MSKFEWTEALDVKQPELNLEHQELISRMNLFAEKNRSALSKDELLKSYQSLVAYTAKHFEDEERYFSSINYTRAAEHRKIHKQLIDKLRGYEQEFRGSVSGRFPNSVFDFFKTWITTHILLVDKEYARVISAVENRTPQKTITGRE